MMKDIDGVSSIYDLINSLKKSILKNSEKINYLIYKKRRDK